MAAPRYRTDFAERLVTARKRAGLSQAQLAKLVGVAQGTISEAETVALGSSKTPAMADALGVSAVWLSSGTGEMFAGVAKANENVKSAPIGQRAYPVISLVQAGALKDCQAPYEPGDGYAVEYGEDEWSKWAFALEIQGDSMLPEFKPGDRVIIDPEIAPGAGDFVVARNNGHETTFKKYRARGIDHKGNNIFELIPMNPDFETLRSDINELCVVGVMVEHRRKYRRRHSN